MIHMDDHERLTCLVVGLGSIGQRHLRNLMELKGEAVRLLAYRALGTGPVLDAKGGVLAGESIADHYNVEIFSAMEDALRQNPDVTFICNPTGLHVPVAQRAAEVGSHLFLEKPVSHNRRGMRKLLRTVEEQKLVTMVGFQFRFHPLLRAVRADLRKGRIGRALWARAEWGEFLPDWHPWEDHRRSYAARTNLGGGVVLTLIHPIDYLIWLLGPVARARGAVRSVPSLGTSAPDDVAEILLEFNHGTIGSVHLDYVQKPAKHRLTVAGEGGRVELDFLKGETRWEGEAGEVSVDSVPQGFNRNDMFKAELTHFLACVSQGMTTEIPLQDGVDSLKVAIDAKRSVAASGRYGGLTVIKRVRSGVAGRVRT